MLTALLLTLASQAEYGSIDEILRPPRRERVTRAGGRSGRGYAFFEFAPAGGAGMGGACACTSPTGAKGEALTFTRTGAATCSKPGLATTGIADGDLVVCASNNQPRVERDADGVLGLRVEGSRTNSLLRSQEFDSASWSKDISNAGNLGSLTANYGTAPDGTVTAERFTCAGGAANCRIFQGVGTGAYAGSLYVRGTSGAGTIYISGLGGGGTTACSYVSSSWSRCTMTAVSQPLNTLMFGCEAGLYGMPATCPAIDALVWQAQMEIGGAYVTSPIPTTSAAATRNAEVPIADAALGSIAAGSVAVSVHTAPNSLGANRGWISLATSTPSWRHGPVGFSTSAVAAHYVNGSASGIAQTVTTGQRRIVAYWSAAERGVGVDGAFLTTTGAASTGDIQRVCIGDYSCAGGTLQDGIFSRICADPDPSRCR